MAYGTFKSVDEVAEKFDIEIVSKTSFVGVKKFEGLDTFFTMIKKKLRDDASYVSEISICESIIRPILDKLTENSPLKVWSHISYNVDKEKGLVGEPDYLIAKRTKYGQMARPALCVIEAKKADFDKGWTQALAEMVASSLLGTTICYSIVTTGEFWQFSKLENNVFTIDSDSMSIPINLQRLFDSINWMFNEISTEN